MAKDNPTHKTGRSWRLAVARRMSKMPSPWIKEYETAQENADQDEAGEEALKDNPILDEIEVPGEIITAIKRANAGLAEKIDSRLEIERFDGPTTAVADILQLVEQRLRSRKAKALSLDEEPTYDQVLDEIEAVLDRVEMCEWMLRFRRSRSKATENEILLLLEQESSIPPELQNLKQGIDASEYPLSFNIGLIRMGISGDSQSIREKKFRPFVDRMNRNPEEFVQALKNKGWPSRKVLWRYAQGWASYWAELKIQNLKKAGEASAKKRIRKARK